MDGGKLRSRRAFLGALPSIPFLSAAAQKKEPETILPSDRKRYADPLTDFEVLRLTDPSYTSYLPPPTNRPVSRRGGFLFYASDRPGTLQALRMDLKTGESTVLTEAEDLQPLSLTLMPDQRGVCYLDGRELQLLSFVNRKTHVIYEMDDGFACTGFSVAEDGRHAFLTEQRAARCRLRLVPLGRGTPETLVEGDGEFLSPLPRPRRAGALYRRGDGTAWLVNYDGQQNRRLRTTGGRVAAATWSPDGRSVFYLAVQEEAKRLNAIREHVPDTNTDAEVSLTSQFVDFDRNADASVFVGASGTRAQPHILLLIRVVKRELTLCEHKASDPRTVHAHFSPNSQRVFFQTDRHGKPSLYCMAVDRLVEATESG